MYNWREWWPVNLYMWHSNPTIDIFWLGLPPVCLLFYEIEKKWNTTMTSTAGPDMRKVLESKTSHLIITMIVTGIVYKSSCTNSSSRMAVYSSNINCASLSREIHFYPITKIQVTCRIWTHHLQIRSGFQVDLATAVQLSEPMYENCLHLVVFLYMKNILMYSC